MAPAKRQGDGPLSRALVLEAAREIVESQGADHLTIRGLASKLGVAVTAIYWHVGNKQALLDALTEQIIAEMGTIHVRGRDPRLRIVSIGRALRRKLLQQPDLVWIVHRQGRTAALFQPVRTVLARELTSAGVRGADAALAIQTILNHVIGSVLVDRTVERQPAQRDAPDELWSIEDVPDAPDLLRHLAHPVGPDALFEYSLGVLVQALLDQ